MYCDGFFNGMPSPPPYSSLQGKLSIKMDYYSHYFWKWIKKKVSGKHNKASLCFPSPISYKWPITKKKCEILFCSSWHFLVAAHFRKLLQSILLPVSQSPQLTWSQADPSWESFWWLVSAVASVRSEAATDRSRRQEDSLAYSFFLLYHWHPNLGILMTAAAITSPWERTSPQRKRRVSGRDATVRTHDVHVPKVALILAV